MATNLVSLIMDFLTPEMIGRIGSALNLEGNKVATAASAGVPGMLAGLSGVAATPGGAQKLVDAARGESGTLGKLADMLEGDRHSGVVARGSQVLGSLLGTGNQNALTEAVGRFSGLGQSSSGSLLGMLAPIVLGTIARQGGLNANSMASLFAGQKDNIAAAMPAGFGRLLGGTGLLDALTDGAEGTTGTPVFRGERPRRSTPAWLWLIPAAVLAGTLAYLLNGTPRQAVQNNVANAQNLTVGGVDIGKQAADNLSGLRTALSGVTDVDSAKAALPKLQQLTDQIDKTDGMIGSLSADQRKTLADQVSPTKTEVNQLFDKVLAIPGVGDVLKPSIDAVRSKLATMAA